MRGQQAVDAVVGPRRAVAAENHTREERWRVLRQRHLDFLLIPVLAPGCELPNRLIRRYTYDLRPTRGLTGAGIAGERDFRSQRLTNSGDVFFRHVHDVAVEHLLRDVVHRVGPAEHRSHVDDVEAVTAVSLRLGAQRHQDWPAKVVPLAGQDLPLLSPVLREVVDHRSRGGQHGAQLRDQLGRDLLMPAVAEVADHHGVDGDRALRQAGHPQRRVRQTLRDPSHHLATGARHHILGPGLEPAVAAEQRQALGHLLAHGGGDVEAWLGHARGSARLGLAGVCPVIDVVAP